MAEIEDLVDEIADPRLRERIASQVKSLKETKSFGLVFEEHIPETVSLHGRSGLSAQAMDWLRSTKLRGRLSAPAPHPSGRQDAITALGRSLWTNRRPPCGGLGSG
jgi:hypothetical protein